MGVSEGVLFLLWGCHLKTSTERKFQKKTLAWFHPECPRSMAIKASPPGCSPCWCFTIMPFKRNESPQGKTITNLSKGLLLFFLFNRILPKSACSSGWFWLGLSDTFHQKNMLCWKIFHQLWLFFHCMLSIFVAAPSLSWDKAHRSPLRAADLLVFGRAG